MHINNVIERKTSIASIAVNWSGTMCLGIPMRVVGIDGFIAHCEAKGVARDVSLFLLQHEPVAAGDYVMVHVGYAIQRMTEEDARSAWELYDEMLAMEGTTDA